MDPKERAEKIREGNRAFNEADYVKAKNLYLETDYKDGLIRMGDYYMYDRKLPILAFGYYKKAGFQQKIDEIYQRMLFALGQWIGMDKLKIQPVEKSQKNPTPIPKFSSKTELSVEDFVVHPILRKKALEILAKNSN